MDLKKLAQCLPQHKCMKVQEFLGLPAPPLIDPHGSLRSERGTPKFRDHALPLDPCRTGGKKGHGRQAGQVAESHKRVTGGPAPKGSEPVNTQLIRDEGKTDPR